MGDQVNRRDLDRELFGKGNRQQLVDLLGQANPHIVAGALVKALEWQIVTDELAREGGVDVSDAQIEAYTRKHREEIARQLDRAVNAFICSVVSQEG